MRLGGATTDSQVKVGWLWLQNSIAGDEDGQEIRRKGPHAQYRVVGSSNAATAMGKVA